MPRLTAVTLAVFCLLSAPGLAQQDAQRPGRLLPEGVPAQPPPLPATIDRVFDLPDAPGWRRPGEIMPSGPSSHGAQVGAPVFGPGWGFIPAETAAQIGRLLDEAPDPAGGTIFAMRLADWRGRDTHVWADARVHDSRGGVCRALSFGDPVTRAVTETALACAGADGRWTIAPNEQAMPAALAGPLRERLPAPAPEASATWVQPAPQPLPGPPVGSGGTQAPLDLSRPPAEESWRRGAPTPLPPVSPRASEELPWLRR